MEHIMLWQNCLLTNHLMSASINNLKDDITHFFNVMVISVSHILLFLLYEIALGRLCYRFSSLSPKKLLKNKKKMTWELAINI